VTSETVKRQVRLSPQSARHQLIASTITVVGNQGFAAATLRQIELHAGAAHGSVRHHFGGHLPLIEAAIAFVADAEREELSSGTHGANTPSDYLDLIAEVVNGWMTMHRQRTIARYEFFLASARHPPLTPLLDRWGEGFRRDVGRLLRTVHGDTSTNAITVFIGTFNGILFEQLTRPRKRFQARTAVDAALASARSAAAAKAAFGVEDLALDPFTFVAHQE
jgi:AcrR family transcriptional regulator